MKLSATRRFAGFSTALMLSLTFGSSAARGEDAPFTIADAMTGAIAERVRLVAQVEPAQPGPGAASETAESALSVTLSDGSSPADQAINYKNFYRNSDPDRWSLMLSVPGWLPGMEGTTELKGVRQNVDLNVSDMVDVLLDFFDGGLMINGEARRGPWTLFLDTVYLELGGRASRNATLPPLLQFAPGVMVNGKVDFDTSTVIVELGGGYRFYDAPWGDPAEARRVSLDVIGGVRYWRLETQIDATVTAALGPISTGASLSVSETEEWVDPFVGLRAQIDLTEKLFLYARADIGGFDLGSDFTWKAAAGLSYNLTPRLSTTLGYQILSVDYSDGDFGYDVEMGGPVLGMCYTFGGPPPRAEAE